MIDLDFRRFMIINGPLLRVLYEQVYNGNIEESPEQWENYCLEKFFKFSRQKK